MLTPRWKSCTQRYRNTHNLVDIIINNLYFKIMNSSEYILVKPSKDRGFRPERWNNPQQVGLSKCFAYAVNVPELGGAYSELMSSVLRDEYLKTGSLSEELILSEASNAEYAKIHINDMSRLYNAKASNAGLIKLDMEQYEPLPSDHIIAIHHFKQHYWRRDSDGTWSHKDDVNPATNKDDAGNIITNLEKAEFLYEGELIPLEYWPGMQGSTEYFKIPEKGILVQKPNFVP